MIRIDDLLLVKVHKIFSINQLVFKFDTLPLR